jgi:lipid-binding SYLF domain-containing protein
MTRICLHLATAACLAVAPFALTSCASDPVTGMNAAQLNRKQLAADSRAALNSLCRSNATARKLRPHAKGILVFPNITKGGFMVGGMGGNGAAIRPDGTIRDFYQTAGLSYGFQAGIQKYGYAIFLMDDDAVRNLNRSAGWDIGSYPGLVIVDEGISTTVSTTSVNRGSYVFFFNQRGLMGGLGLQGSKITRL